MASTKSASGKNGRNKIKTKEQEYIPEEEYGVGSEIAVWVTGAVMLILELANFGLCGAVKYVSGFFFGIFGVIQYIIPVAVLFSAFFLYVNEYKKRAVHKVVFGFLVLMCIGMIAQMAEGGLDHYDFKQLFGMGYGLPDGGHAGGGVLCGSLAFLLNKAVGEVGTYIIIILAIIISIMLFTEGSLIDFIKNVTDRKSVV